MFGDGPLSLSEVTKRYRQLNINVSNPTRTVVRIALLSNFTIRGMAEALTVAFNEHGIVADVWTCPYAQQEQYVYDAKSELYTREPQVIIVLNDIEKWFGLHEVLTETLTFRDALQTRSEIISNQLHALLQTLLSRSKANVYWSGFDWYENGMNGMLADQKGVSLLTQMITKMNADIVGAFGSERQFYYFDFPAFAREIGQQQLYDLRLRQLADLCISPEWFYALGHAFVRSMYPLIKSPSKCIVLDLDHTIWGGVLGEDGFEGIRMGQRGDGWAFWMFQHGLKLLKSRGFLLSIVSRNELADVEHVLRAHSDAVLKYEDFVAIRCNWERKSGNIRSIADELNIGLDALIFFDDDPVNRAEVRSAVPEVIVPELSLEPLEYHQLLRKLPSLQVYEITEEDSKRTQMYLEQRKRSDAKSSFESLDAYLQSLKLEVLIDTWQQGDLKRLEQLFQRTNQFNTTHIRLTQQQLLEYRERSDVWCRIVRINDRFGDHGDSGAVIVYKVADQWVIEMFLLSCRVLGRGIEDAVIATVAKNAASAGARKIIVKYTEHPKNTPVKQWLAASPFLPTQDGYAFDLVKEYPYKMFIQIKESLG